MRQSPAPNRQAILRDLPLATEPVGLPCEFRFVFLCFTNRCGSAFLGDLLQSTGVFAQARESLNAGDVLATCRTHGLDSFQKYFSHIVRRDAKDGIFIVKAAPEQLVLLTDAGILDEIIDRSAFLFLNRSDKVAQAISRMIAEQNNSWDWRAPKLVPDGELAFSSARVAGHLEYVIFLNQCFELFFNFNGLSSVTIEYERLMRAPQQEMDEIATLLRLPALRIAFDRLRYRQQANEINEAWHAWFLASPPGDSGDTSLKPPAPRVAEVAGPVEPEPPAPAPVAAVDVVVHIQDIGDTPSGLTDWIGTPGSGLWIEGFSILPRGDLAPEDIEYQAIRDLENQWPWHLGGQFCGTRDVDLPLRGFAVRLRNAAAGRYRCSYVATFVDGSKAGPVAEGQLCRGPTLAPLEAFQLTFERL